MLRNFWNIVAQITEGEAIKAACMSGKNRCGDDSTFNSHSGNKRQRNSDRSLAKAVNILYCNYSLHKIPLLKFLVAKLYNYQSLLSTKIEKPPKSFIYFKLVVIVKFVTKHYLFAR